MLAYRGYMVMLFRNLYQGMSSQRERNENKTLTAFEQFKFPQSEQVGPFERLAANIFFRNDNV